jgi:hypothetical protein
MSDATPFHLKLTDEEVEELMKVSGGGPVQKMQEMLKEQLADGKNTLSLNDMALGRVVRMMTQGPAPVQTVLKKTLRRALLEAMAA